MKQIFSVYKNKDIEERCIHVYIRYFFCKKSNYISSIWFQFFLGRGLPIACWSHSRKHRPDVFADQQANPPRKIYWIDARPVWGIAEVILAPHRHFKSNRIRLDVVVCKLHRKLYRLYTNSTTLIITQCPATQKYCCSSTACSPESAACSIGVTSMIPTGEMAPQVRWSTFSIFYRWTNRLSAQWSRMVWTHT